MMGRYPALLRHIWTGLSARRFLLRCARIIALFSLTLLPPMALCVQSIHGMQWDDWMVAAIIDIFITVCIAPSVVAIVAAWEVGGRIDEAVQDERRTLADRAGRYGFHRGTWSLVEETDSRGRLSPDMAGGISSSQG